MDNSIQAQEPAGVSEPAEEPEDGSAPLVNSRHELFCQYRALGGYDIGECYRRAGGKATGVQSNRQGYKIAYRPEVKLRILWLKAHQAQALEKENVMGRREILQELKTNMELGRVVKGGLTASNRALELIGSEEHDMFVQKRENRNRKVDELDGLDPDQLIDFIQRAADRIPGVELDAEALAAACGVKRRPALGDGGTTGNSPSSAGSEIPSRESV